MSFGANNPAIMSLRLNSGGEKKRKEKKSIQTAKGTWDIQGLDNGLLFSIQCTEVVDTAIMASSVCLQTSNSRVD